MVVAPSEARRESRAISVATAEPPPTAAELRQWEQVGKPALEAAVREATTDQVERAAATGSKIAAAELISRGVTPPKPQPTPAERRATRRDEGRARFTEIERTGMN